MNIENMTKLRDHLRDNVTDQMFRMDLYIEYDSLRAADCSVDDLRCNTVGCIAGHATLLLSDEHDIRNTVRGAFAVRERAMDLLGLDDDEASNLFSGAWTDKPQESITRLESVDYLTALLGGE